MRLTNGPIGQLKGVQCTQLRLGITRSTTFTLKEWRTGVFWFDFIFYLRVNLVDRTSMEVLSFLYHLLDRTHLRRCYPSTCICLWSLSKTWTSKRRKFVPILSAVQWNSILAWSPHHFGTFFSHWPCTGLALALLWHCTGIALALH